MLSETRKYKLFMTMAEQSTSQQKDQQMVSIILANVGTVICFRTGNPQDEMLLPLFSPYIEQGEIANLSSFNLYTQAIRCSHARTVIRSHATSTGWRQGKRGSRGYFVFANALRWQTQETPVVTNQGTKPARPRAKKKKVAMKTNKAAKVPGGR